MEFSEARALKSSFLSQMAMKTNYQNDDVWCLTGINNSVASSDDNFPVEELLNLDFQEAFSFSQEDEVPQKQSSNNSSSTFSGAGEIDSLSELAVPVDDLENLEWLSQFVDDSASGLSLLCPSESFNAGVINSSNRFEPVNRPRALYFPVPVPGKARSKRSRKSSGQPWSLASPPPLSSPDSLPTPSSSSYGSSTLSPFVFTKPVRDAEWRKPESDRGSGRKCTHCQVQKTPQWRSGPFGPKTLCNACGVRYKSGRLFPEYRPAFSPTFSRALHSNSHRKVLEMRQKKEMVEIGKPAEPCFTRVVQSS